MPTYTAAQVASMLTKADGTPVNPSRVRQLAAELAIGTKFAGVWMFDDADVARLAARHARPGPVPRPDSKPRRRRRTTK